MAPRLGGPASASFGADQGYDNEAGNVEDAADAAKGWWRLVWCHERCHKSQNEDSRQAIRNAVQDYGGSLICLKKARQFGLWMDRAPRPPYVLATDWREAQPCMQIIAQSSGSNRPMVIVVVCEAKRQLTRASEWAQGLAPELGLVHVCERSSIPATLLDGLILRCFGPTSSACAGQPQTHSSWPTASGPPVPAALMASPPAGLAPAGAAQSFPAHPAPCGAGSAPWRRCGSPGAVPDGVPAFWSGSEDDAADGSYAEVVRLQAQAYTLDVGSTGTPSTAPYDEVEDLTLEGVQGDGFSRGCRQPGALPGQHPDAGLLKFHGGPPGLLQQGVCEALWRRSCLPPGRGAGGGPPEPEMVPLPLARLRLRL